MSQSSISGRTASWKKTVAGVGAAALVVEEEDEDSFFALFAGGSALPSLLEDNVDP